MRLDSDDFQLFGLSRRFTLDVAELDERRRALQAEVHPDRFAAADAAARRASAQWAVRVNEAHARLKDPLCRAAYLCELGGVGVRAEDNTAMPAGFLIRQMAWREALDDAADHAAVEALRVEVEQARAAGYARLASDIDVAQDFALAADETRALMFVERFADDVEERLHALEA